MFPEDAVRQIRSLIKYSDYLNTQNCFYEIENIHLRTDASIKTLCDFFGVSRSGYYKFLKHRDDKITKNLDLRQEIIKVQKAYEGTAGYRTVALHINKKRTKNGEKPVSNGRVYRVMKFFGLFSNGIDSKRNVVIARGIKDCENLIGHNFNNRDANECWCIDITEIPLLCGYKLYLCAIIELASRRIVAYNIAKNQKAPLVYKTVQKALNTNLGAIPKIIHSDNGAQFFSKEYLKILRNNDTSQSTSKPGTPGDNAVIEAFFSCLKRECLYCKELVNESVAQRHIRQYVNFFNGYRILHRFKMTPDERYVMLCGSA